MVNAMWSFIGKKQVSDSDPGWPSVYKDDLVAAYSANNKRVRQVVPRRRLLIHDHRKGWTLLAKFLGKDIPNKPYPHRNTRAELIRFGRRLSMGASLTAVVFLAIAAYVVKRLAQPSGTGSNKKVE